MSSRGGSETDHADQMVPTTGPFEWILDEMDFSQGQIRINEPLRYVSGDYMGTYDFLREVLSSDIEDEGFEE